MRKTSLVSLNMLTRLFLMSGLIAALVGFSGCGEDDEEPIIETNTIADIVGEDPRFTILLAALEEAELTATFQGDGPFTVFAPTDDAFNAFLNANNLTAAELLANPQLETILQYHVVSGSVGSSQLSNGAVPTLAGDIYVNVDNGVVINGYSSVTDPDIPADNGTIHVINSVLVPPSGTIVDIAAANDNFETLVSLLQQYGLDDALAADGPFTVFAPTDDAFANIQATLDGLSDAEIQDILLYHVVPGRVFSNDLSTGSAETLNPRKELPIEVNGGITVGGVSVSPANANILGTNGVIHIVDEVLLPERTVVDVALYNDNFSLLVAALQKANLVETLDTESDLTVFAPTNAAFEAALTALGFTGIDDPELTAEVLTPILLHHVLSLGSPALSTDLVDGTFYETLNGAAIQFDANALAFIDGAGNSVPLNAGLLDLEESNGVVHVLDGVLVPPSLNVVEIAAGNADFETLVSLVQRVGLDATLSGEGPFTIFAPTDQAFTDLGIDPATLTDEQVTDILSYHVVSGRVYSSDLADGATVPVLLEGADVVVNIGASVTITDDNATSPDATVVGFDIQGTNGVIHVIDKVLLPE